MQTMVYHFKITIIKDRKTSSPKTNTKYNLILALIRSQITQMVK